MPEHDHTSPDVPGPLCRQFDEQVSDLLLAKDLDHEFGHLVRHRQACARCSAEWSTWSDLIGELATLPMRAEPLRVRARLEGALQAEGQADEALVSELKALPSLIRPAHVWNRIERAVQPRRWSALLEVATLAATAALLVAFLGMANQPALEWATQHLPANWSSAVARLGASPYGGFFSIGLFGAFSALACLISAPLLVHGLRGHGVPRIAARQEHDRITRYTGERTWNSRA